MRRVTPTGLLATVAPPQTPDWYAARREGITGTDLPKILGLSKYGNALSVWMDKRGELADQPGEAARWGELLEDVVAREWVERGTEKTFRVQRVGILAHKDEPWQRASLDRVVIGCPDDPNASGFTCGLEIKTRSAFKAEEWAEAIPDSVLAQVAWGRLVSGLDHMHIAALIGGQRLVTFRYDRDEKLEDYLIEQAAPIWQSVLDGLPPQVDPDADGVLLDLLDRMHRDRQGDRELDPAQALAHIAAYREAAAEEKEAAGRKTQAKTALVQLLGDGATGLVDGVPRFTYAPDKPREVVSSGALKTLREDQPDVYAALVDDGVITTTNPRPTFQLKTIKED